MIPSYRLNAAYKAIRPFARPEAQHRREHLFLPAGALGRARNKLVGFRDARR
jgi:hypothetical protein